MKLRKGLNIILIFSLLLTVMFSFSACGDKTASEENTPTVVNTDEVIDNGTEDNPDVSQSDNEENADNKDKEEAPVIPEVKFINKLTGLETTEEISKIRPIAMMINNIQVATPQQGISHADVIYEVLAEGGISRLLCLFTEYADLPETGSIRSSRDYYIDISDAHDAIYVHCGGSPVAYETLAARKTENMDGIYFNTPFYRNEWRKKNMGMEHSMMTTGERLVKGISEKGYRTESDAKQPLSFKESFSEIEGTSATSASVKYSYYATSTFDYDEETKTYLKGQFSAPHIDSNDNSQLAFTNVLLLYANQGAVKGDDKGRLFVSFTGDGEGKYITGGKVTDIKWHKDSRTSSYTLYEADGKTELLLNPGKTYIGIPPLGAETYFS